MSSHPELFRNSCAVLFSHSLVAAFDSFASRQFCCGFHFFVRIFVLFFHFITTVRYEVHIAVVFDGCTFIRKGKKTYVFRWECVNLMQIQHCYIYGFF